MLAKSTKALFGAIALSLSALVTAAPPLDVTADSAVILDAQSGKVLWGKDLNTARYPASTTKIMTAMLLIERCLPTDVITAPPGIDKVDGASLHLVSGEQLTAQEMLYGVLLRSANDGCVAVATHISGSVAGFVQLMNQRAKEIGCTNTHFDNPNGLNDDNHTISAYDLSLIAREAMKYPAFREVVGNRRHELKRSINTQDRFLLSKNKYLSEDPTADGIKTGWTKPAGQCYVGSATRNGYRIITVVLHATNWKDDNKKMLDWAFENHDRKLVAKAGQPLGDVKIEGGTKSSLAATVSEDLYHVFDKMRPTEAIVKLELDPKVQAPIARGQQIGMIEVSDADGWVERVPLIATDAVPRNASMMSAGPTGWFLFLGAIGSGAYFLKRRTRRVTQYAKTLRRRQA
jgi:D-alanyl-D-alanine carboxypeptidase (penicillin-binding protein 5/6)